ncbi:MAG TPA: hypothetical protein VK338_00080, partial [Candidatus Nitrosocosmicus sp.]|nr:hypothetical protein [Candidatus Nitrosocosmicus sp.]
QNAFLKTLEEKNERVQFILQISSESSVLSTIVSRCKTIKIKSTTTLKNTDILPFTELLGIYGDMTKEKAIKLCDEWLHIYHEKIHADDFAINHNLVKEILRIKNLIVSNNLNAQLAIDHLILQFKK